VKGKRENLSEMILNYLRKHPDSGDTLEGITKWWLGLEKIDTSVDEVAAVMQSLIKKGKITMYVTRGGTTFYKGNND
jgi:hypothetical protein